MLVDVQYLENTKKLICSYVDDSGDIKLKYYDWEQPFQYETCDANDKDVDPLYMSWDKKNIKKVPVSRPDRYSIYEYLDALDDKEKNDVFDFHLPKIFFIDIETEVLDEFPDPRIAPTQIQSISIVYDSTIILMALKDLPQDAIERIEVKTNDYFKKYNTNYKIKYVKYEDEFSMLYTFFEKMVVKMPVLTGWNFINFDWQFLVNRAKRITKTVGGKLYTIDPRVSSPTKRLNKVWMTDYEVPAHRMIFDYMQLYQICDTSIKVKESSSLDFVADKLVGLPKIKYTGSLMQLYEDDFELFMYYNCVDSVLVQKIHEKMDYISIIFAIASLSKIKVVDVISQMNNALGSLAITEGVLRSRFRDMENMILFKDKNKARVEATGIAGGWVKDPVVGMNKWVVVYDFSSLYPSVQRQFFIAPETFIGVQIKSNPDYCLNGNKEVLIDHEKHVICINGCVFEKRVSPTIQMLQDVFKERKSFKKEMMKYKEEYSNVLDQIKELEMSLEM